MRGLHNLKAKTRVTIKFYSRLIGGYIALFTAIFAFGWIFDKTLETAFMFVGYFLTRFAVPRIKHFDTTQKCISISTMTFIFGIAIMCIPNNVSLVWSAMVGNAIPLIMYAESLLFDPVVSEKDKLIALCKLHNYNEIKTEIAVKFFVDKQKPKEVWIWLCEEKNYPISWDSVYVLKSKMKKDLF